MDESTGLKHQVKKSDKLMKISEFAKVNELSARTLRLYEEQGLLQPVSKSDSGFRFYTSEQQIRIRFIQKMKDLGCSLQEIQSLMQHWGEQSTATQGMQTLEKLYIEKLQKVRMLIENLQGIESELAHSLEFIQGCHTCEVADTPQSACSQCDRPQSSDLTLIRGVTKGS